METFSQLMQKLWNLIIYQMLITTLKFICFILIITNHKFFTTMSEWSWEKKKKEMFSE